MGGSPHCGLNVDCLLWTQCGLSSVDALWTVLCVSTVSCVWMLRVSLVDLWTWRVCRSVGGCRRACASPDHAAYSLWSHHYRMIFRDACHFCLT